MTTRIDEQLANLRGLGGQQFVCEMIDLFLENAPKQLGAARIGMQAGDLVMVHRAAHSLKSSAGNFGAEALRELAGRIERLTGENKADTLPALLDELEAAFAQTRSYLEEKKQQQG